MRRSQSALCTEMGFSTMEVFAGLQSGRTEGVV